MADAVLRFNEGAVSKTNVFERLQLQPGKFMINGLQTIDKITIVEAEKEAEEQTKESRVKRRLLKRQKVDKHDDNYSPGEF